MLIFLTLLKKQKIFIFCSIFSITISCSFYDSEKSLNEKIIRTNKTLKDENIGSTGQLIGRYPINGIIYDNNNNIIPNANIKIKIISSRFLQDMSEKNITSDDNGRYVFRSILDNTEIELYISKIGYKSVLRNYIVDSNLYLISLKPVGNINFGGEGEDKKYALEKIM